MPEDHQELRRINWGEAFPFTQLFRSFRLAIHPSKLILALLAVLSIYFVGRVMDVIWPKTVTMVLPEAPAGLLAPQASEGRTLTEVRAYIDLRGGKRFCAWRSEAKKAASTCSKACSAQGCGDACTARPKGIFGTLLEHESTTFRAAIRSVLCFNTGIGTSPSMGLKGALVDALGGIVWLFAAHWLYGVIFTVVFLLSWSFFGGAICRIAALHAARDEKIAFKQALTFSGRKLFSFFSAPLIPVALVCVIGVIMFAGGLFCAIPYFGEVVAGLLWPLALFGGFIMSLVMIGAVSGFMLMFPTVAVEGSDSFDALSRSFSYVYSKPWRTGFYVLVSGFYGAICYSFVRLFAHVMLNATHLAAGLGMNIDGSGKDSSIGKLDAIWQNTSFLEPGRFWGVIGAHPLNDSEKIAAGLIGLWTYLVVGLVAAFAVSYFFSASTIIYYLLRREVDATDIEDVYLEEYEEDSLAPAVEAKAPAAAEAPVAPPQDQTPPPIEGQGGAAGG
jgi:hypothetical protein